MPTGHDWLAFTTFSSMHSPAARAVGRAMLTAQLPADVAGAPHVNGAGVGLADGDGSGLGDGLGSGVGLGSGDGLGPGDGSGDGPGAGVGEGLGSGEGDGEGLGDGCPVTITWTVAVADELPARAMSVYEVVQVGLTLRFPRAPTSPTPLLISMRSAPTTSQVKVVVEPDEISVGVATNRTMASGSASVTSPLSKSEHPGARAPPTTANAARGRK
jgi:hypothetical protein